MLNSFLINRSASMFHNSAKPFSVAYNVKSQFEKAYKQKMDMMAKVPPKM